MNNKEQQWQVGGGPAPHKKTGEVNAALIIWHHHNVKLHFDQLLVDSWSTFGRLFVSYWSILGRLLLVRRPTLSRLLVSF